MRKLDPLRLYGITIQTWLAQICRAGLRSALEHLGANGARGVFEVRTTLSVCIVTTSQPHRNRYRNRIATGIATDSSKCAIAFVLQHRTTRLYAVICKCFHNTYSLARLGRAVNPRVCQQARRRRQRTACRFAAPATTRVRCGFLPEAISSTASSYLRFSQQACSVRSRVHPRGHIISTNCSSKLSSGHRGAPPSR